MARDRTLQDSTKCSVARCRSSGTGMFRSLNASNAAAGRKAGRAGLRTRPQRQTRCREGDPLFASLQVALSSRARHSASLLRISWAAMLPLPAGARTAGFRGKSGQSRAGASCARRETHGRQCADPICVPPPAGRGRKFASRTCPAAGGSRVATGAHAAGTVLVEPAASAARLRLPDSHRSLLQQPCARRGSWSPAAAPIHSPAHGQVVQPQIKRHAPVLLRLL
jgi:hypothetical protein